MGHLSIFRTRSTDHGLTWSAPEVVTHLTLENWGGPMPLLDQDGELHFVIPQGRADNGRKPGDGPLHRPLSRRARRRAARNGPNRSASMKATAARCRASSSSRAGASSCRSPTGCRACPPRHRPDPRWSSACTPMTGAKLGSARPRSSPRPCHEGFNGANYGACEPTLIELKDGRVWMLIRTQAGFLYESFSEMTARTGRPPKPRASIRRIRRHSRCA